ncbi:hypothetical protein QJQ45_007277 [Haematococcus lacustris]|nr:hypothetical protein QJQ45_007277 [Haematococcus lacustris]
MAEVSMEHHKHVKQLVVFFGAAGINTRGGWGADAVLRACCKVPTAWEPGLSSPPPVKRRKRTKADQAAEPPQPTKGIGKTKGKAADAKPASQPGRWVDRDCNAVLNMLRVDCRKPEDSQRCAVLRPVLSQAKQTLDVIRIACRVCQEEAAMVVQQWWGTRKQLVVFLGNAGTGTFCTSRVSSAMNSPQPYEEELDRSKPTSPEGWKPQLGQVQDRLLWSAWSNRSEAPVRGLMWYPKLDQAMPGDIGRWVDRDCNAALNLQRIGEAPWRPLELCKWPHRARTPAQGKEYPGLGFKKLRD